ncbi:Hypothetical_protein [Hexamita inflata]|uniref:Hypothetical_protein n=1 Tax=Hexamita inflata TaxID=28002 RepID=A0AA86RMU0_9EUKA|nr:Hypothetical protein HINF_LOCUS26110 [Hexamita inflata]CAI9947632.1 Hypothetical protein HINF_LOCUS35277 [Hexamita inflata]CAI9976458.1 Hypothetical protein HINF_LOCUS64103 [Hexamita inflata]
MQNIDKILSIKERLQAKLKEQAPKNQKEIKADRPKPNEKKFIAPPPSADRSKLRLMSLEDVHLQSQMSEVKLSNQQLPESSQTKSCIVFENEEPLRGPSPLSQILRSSEVRSSTPVVQLGKTEKIDFGK